MTSLFSNSLLIGTDRDLRGVYRLFSRPKVHAVLGSSGMNDRSSATFNVPRKNFSLTAKEMAKTQSLAASLRNMTDYLSLIERARNTIQAVENKLEELDDVVTEASGILDSDDFRATPVGAIESLEISGLASGIGTFNKVSLTDTSGEGNGAVVTVRADGSGNYEVVNMDAEGREFKIGDRITVKGSALGGSAGLNDATLEVTAVSSRSEEKTFLKIASDDIDRLTLQLHAETLVTNISDIINASEFWDEDIFGGLRAIGYAQVGHTVAERTLIDIQELSTSTIGSYLNAYFVNGSFATTSDAEGSYVDEAQPNMVGTVAKLHGWDIHLEQVALGPAAVGSDAANGLISTLIGNFQTPDDSTPTPQNADSPAQVSRGDGYRATGGSFSYSVASDGLQLISNNLTVNGGNVVHGPYLISQNPVELNVGDKISFSWKGEVTDNAYDAYSYLLNADTGSSTELLNSTGNSTTGFATVEHTISSSASYYFVFVAGSFDYDFIGTITTASASGSSPISGAIAASSSGTAASSIASVSASGTSVGNSTFNSVSQSSTTGNGSGATFTIAANGSGNYTVNSIAASGNSYQVGDSLTISGASLGGVSTTNDLTLTVSAIDSASHSVSQSSTDGSGTGAIFNLSSNSAGNYSVSEITTFGSNYAVGDQVTITGSNLGGVDGQNDATLTLSSVGATSISNVSQASTSGNGSGARFTISIDGSGNYSGVSVSTGGSNYEMGDTISVLGSSLGGISPTHDLTLTVGDIQTTSGAILHVNDLTVTRANNPTTTVNGIDVSTQSAAADAANVIADALKQIQYRKAYLEGKEIALLDSINNISTQTTSTKLLTTDLGVQQTVRELKKFDVVNAILSNVHKAQYLLNSGLLQLIKS